MRTTFARSVFSQPVDGSDVPGGDLDAARAAVGSIRAQLAALKPLIVPMVGTEATVELAAALGAAAYDTSEVADVDAARLEVQRIREQLAALHASFSPAPQGGDPATVVAATEAIAREVWSKPEGGDDIEADDLASARAAVSAIRTQLARLKTSLSFSDGGAPAFERAAAEVAREAWTKPEDGADIADGDLEAARAEVQRIRKSLAALSVVLSEVDGLVDNAGAPEPPPGGAEEIALIKAGLQKRGTAEVIEMMRALDRDMNGVLERDEFANGLLVAAFIIPAGKSAADVASPQMLFIAHKLFDIFDSDRGGNVDFKELAGGLTAMSSTDPMVTCRVVFDLYDDDRNDEISKEEMLSYMLNMLRMSAATGAVAESLDIESTASVMVERCFEAFDTDDSGVVNFDEFSRWFTGQSAAPRVGGDPRSGPRPDVVGDAAVEVANDAATAAYNSAFEAMQSLTLVLVARDAVHADAEASLRRTTAIAMHKAATLKALVHTLQVATKGWRARERDLMDQVDASQRECEVLKERVSDRMHERTRSLRAHEIRAMDLRQKVALVEREIDRTPTSQVATHRILRQRVGTLKLELKETLEQKEEELLHHHDELDAARAQVAEHITQADRARAEIALANAGLPEAQRNAPSADPRRHELGQLEVEHLRTALRELASVATEQAKLSSDAQRAVLLERRENQTLREQMGERLTDFARKTRELEVAEHALEDQIAALREHSALTGARVRRDGIPVRDQGTLAGTLRSMTGARSSLATGRRAESSLERTLRATGPGNHPHTTRSLMNPESEIDRLTDELEEVRAAKRELKQRQGEMMKTQFQGEVQRMLVQNLSSVLALEPQQEQHALVHQRQQPPQQQQQALPQPQQTRIAGGASQTIHRSKELLRQSYLEPHTAPYFAHPQQQAQPQQIQPQYALQYAPPSQQQQARNPHLSQWLARNSMRVQPMQPGFAQPQQQPQMMAMGAPGPWYQTPLPGHAAMPLAQGSPLNWARNRAAGF